ncbi:hypothetical protein [Microlunatus soli]|uniref:Lipoprotein n=1 Tax=Microlunatus soli TaxID=630515 RepID=A0A1H1XIN2_9ACTN|nr:hypothetical protein [Microlunatus soli]SDT08931.1 hypothetical protein SAMN04489812_4095 [Microlunatus soli]
MRPPLPRLTAVLLLLAMTAGCALVDGRSEVGRLLTSWSQADDQRITTVSIDGTVVLADDADRQRFLDRLPDELDRSAVEAADLDSGFLVLGGYGKCMQRSRVWMDTDRTAVWFEVYVPRKLEGVNCGWSPFTIDVWLVPREELRTTPADRLRNGEPG